MGLKPDGWVGEKTEEALSALFDKKDGIFEEK